MPAPGPLFTAEIARAASKLGAAARKRRADILTRLDDITARLARLEKNGHRRIQPEPSPAFHAPRPQPVPDTLNDTPAESPPDFALVRLARVRAMLDQVDRSIATGNHDALALERLGRMARSLHDQWCDLSGHSRAGQRKPGREKVTAPSAVDVRPLGRAVEVEAVRQGDLVSRGEKSGPSQEQNANAVCNRPAEQAPPELPAATSTQAGG